MGCRSVTVLGKLLNINDGTVGDAADLVEPLAPVEFDLSRAFLASAKHQVCDERSTRAARKQGVKTKGEHNFWMRAQEALLFN